MTTMALGLALGLRVLSIALLALELGPAGQGTVALAALIATLGAGLASVGLEPGLLTTAALPVSRPSARAALWTQTLVVAVAVTAALAAIAVVGHVEDAIVVGVLAVPALLFLRLAAACALGEHRPRVFVALTVLPWLAYFAWIAGLAASETLTQRSALIALAGSLVATAFCSAIPVAWTFKPRLELPWRSRTYSVGLRVFPGFVAQLANYRFDQLVVAAVLSRSQLGLYTVAVAGAEAGTLPAQGTASAVIPDATRTKSERGSYRSAAVVSAGLALAAAPIFVLALWIVLPEYRDSLVPYALLLPGVAAVAASKVVAAHMIGRGQSWATSEVALKTLIVSVPLTLLVIPLFGIVGAAIASSISYAIMLWLLLRASRRPRAPQGE
jgi:O-antigen/teichoic acid export membrane protein